MTPAELNRLRDLAQAATPGPWRVCARWGASQEVARVNNLEVAPPDSVELSHCATDAAYIAAVSPDVVLGLIDEVLTSRRRIGALTTLTDAQTARLQSYMNDGAKRAEAITTLASEREANAILTSEVERLRAQLAAAEAFHKVVVAERNYEREINSRMQVENEWLRADAERYRWLRDPANANADEWNLFGPYSSPKEVDAAIDAAMKEDK
jgi:hypothetical protein